MSRTLYSRCERVHRLGSRRQVDFIESFGLPLGKAAAPVVCELPMVAASI
jgi:hypothetical protein